jgi:hypothetical protein
MNETQSKPVIKSNNSGYKVTYTETVFAKNLDKIASVFKVSSPNSSQSKITLDNKPTKK